MTAARRDEFLVFFRRMLRWVETHAHLVSPAGQIRMTNNLRAQIAELERMPVQ